MPHPPVFDQPPTDLTTCGVITMAERPRLFSPSVAKRSVTSTAYTIKGMALSIVDNYGAFPSHYQGVDITYPLLFEFVTILFDITPPPAGSAPCYPLHYPSDNPVYLENTPL
eukprot:412352-Prorocentrum_minimum.AAC.1